MSRARLWWAGVLAVTFCLAACAREIEPTTNVRQVVSTTSFGECAGYCLTRLEISEGQAVLIREGHGGGAPDLPEQRISTALTQREWREIASLAASTSLQGLPPVIGCPDCADGGAESLTITNANESRSVSFEYGATIEQAQPLLVRVRALRTRMMPKS